MELKRIIRMKVDENDKEQFNIKLMNENIRRGRIYSILIILLELILSMSDIILASKIQRADFKFDSYLIMYIIMITVNALYITYFINLKVTKDNLNRVQMVLRIYVLYMMSWGAVVSLMDQKLYGQVVVYLVNVMICSTLYNFEYKKMLINYVVSATILFVGLPFFQGSVDIVIGHYINTLIFLSCAWVASRMFYKNSYVDYKSNNKLIQLNEELKKEVEENEKIQKQLEDFNEKLKEISFFDDLTKLYNRRALKDYMKKIVSENDAEFHISVVMMDIDSFKSYNDKYGHVQGDEVLRSIGFALKYNFENRVEFVGRYGGEEFIVISANMDPDEMHEIATDINKTIYELNIPHEFSNVCEYITVSVGLATMEVKDFESIFNVIEKADEALYTAKKTGKNRVCACSASGTFPLAH